MLKSKSYFVSGLVWLSLQRETVWMSAFFMMFLSLGITESNVGINRLLF